MLRGGDGYLGFFIQPSLFLALGAEVDQHTDEDGEFNADGGNDTAPKFGNEHQPVPPLWQVLPGSV